MTGALAVVFEAIRAAGLTLSARGDRVRLEPADRVTPALLELVRQHKAALLAALAAEGGENDNGKKDALSEPAPPPADLARPADLAGPCPPGVAGDHWAALLADVSGDVELLPKLHALPADQLACWRECLARRITAGEALPGLPWRALVDVRLRFEPEAWTAGLRRAQRQSAPLAESERLWP